MVRTTHPGNIGAAARAMGVSGLAHLALVSPQTSATNPDAVARAASSGSILDNSATYPDLGAALANCQRAYAFTARRRDMKHLILDARAASAKANQDLAAGNQVALVFGPEQSGLTNEEIQLCDCIVEISTVPGKSSLNVAAAIQIACHELLMATDTSMEGPARDLATKQDLQDALIHVNDLMQEFCPPQNEALRKKMLGRLNLLLNRASPEKSDVRMLRGLLASVGKLGRNR